jgi:DNA-directed RNA polymerase subunit RPC12/RpoP
MSIAFDEIRTVNVCLRCGKGFPDWVPLTTQVDTLETWRILSAGLVGPKCGGRIMTVPRGEWIAELDRNNEIDTLLEANANEREATSHACRSGGADILPAGTPEPGDPEEG